MEYNYPNGKNSTTDYLSELAGVEDLLDVEEEDDYSMDTKAYRECRQILGIEDAETVVDMKTRKTPRAKTKPGHVTASQQDAQSVISDMTGMTAFSLASQASRHRKDLRSKVNSQQLDLNKKELEIERLRALLESMQQKAEISTNQGTSAEGVGKESGDSLVIDITHDSMEDQKPAEREEVNQESEESVGTDEAWVVATKPMSSLMEFHRSSSKEMGVPT